MHILISPVGLNDPFGTDDTEGSVLTLANTVRPDVIFLLYTWHPSGRARTERGELLDFTAKAEQIATLLQRSGDGRPEVHLLPLVVEDPTDYAVILPVLERAAQHIRERLRGIAQPLHLHVSAASGTPTIKTSMMLLVSSGVLSSPSAGPARVYLVANPHHRQEDQRVSEVDVTIVEAARLAAQIDALMRRGDLDAARHDAQWLTQIAYSAERRACAALVDRYLEGLQRHQRLAYASAEAALRQVRDEVERTARLHRLAPILDRQVAYLRRLIENGSDDQGALLHDLLLNAEWHARRGDYADALARCWAVMEEALRVYRRRIADPDSAAPPSVTLYQAVDHLLSRGDPTAVETFRNAPLDQAMRDDAEARVGEQLQRHAGTAFATQVRPRLTEGMRTYRDLFAWLGAVRNHSPLAHGHIEVGVVEARLGVALARHVLTSFDVTLAVDHPFALGPYLEAVDEIHGALIFA